MYSSILPDEKARSKDRRKVRFSPALHLFPALERSDYTLKEITACWWTSDEMHHSHHKIAALIKKQLPVPVTDSATRMLNALRDMQECSKRIASRKENKPCPRELQKRFTFWANKAGKLRGLEKAITNKASSRGLWHASLRKDEAAAVRSLVIHMQDNLINADKEIAAVYAAQSRAAAAFAYQLGLADEQLQKQ
jgi:hypothetical protein